MKSISVNKNKEVKLLKRKQNSDNMMVGGSAPDYNQGFRKVTDEDTSNRSSSGSAISNSESCAQFGSADASDLTGWTLATTSSLGACSFIAKRDSILFH